MSLFIKISYNENLEDIINVDEILRIIKGEDLQLIEVENHEEFKTVPSYTLIMKSSGPIKITEYMYKQIREKIKELMI